MIGVGDKIKDILDLKGMSQKQFALLLQIPCTTLSGYLNNKHEPDFKTLVDIANTLNISVDYLLSNNKTDKPLNSEEILILQRFRVLTEEQKELIKIQLEVMKKQNAKKNKDCL